MARREGLSSDAVQILQRTSAGDCKVFVPRDETKTARLIEVRAAGKTVVSSQRRSLSVSVAAVAELASRGILVEWENRERLKLCDGVYLIGWRDMELPGDQGTLYRYVQ